MSQITAVAGLVDGSVQAFQVTPSDLERHRSAGLTGKALIVALLGDDIRPRPVFVYFSGVEADGSLLRLEVPFT